MASSLLTLEEDLTCSICLCAFDGPVSLACGHSFCQVCLEAAWKEAGPVSCPQCRTVYPERPALRRNTVLSAVADAIRSASDGPGARTEPEPETQPEPKPEPEPVLCDTCMVAKAESTCMTCAASFCAEHVRPHRENPVYRAHRLAEPPLADLRQRLCPEHAKLREFYCAPHEAAICSSCLHDHRDCGFRTVEEQRVLKQSELKDKLGTLDGKIEKNQMVISQMREQQAKLKDVAAVRKRALEAEYQQLMDRLQRDEKEALNALDKDLESGQSKLNNLMKKFNQNIEKMSGTKNEINRLLARSDTLDFLQVSVEMPSVVAFDPYSPRINLDSKQVIAYHACISTLKELVFKVLNQAVENRISLLKPELEKAFAAKGADKSPTPLPNPRDTAVNPSIHQSYQPFLQPYFAPPMSSSGGAPDAGRTPPCPFEGPGSAGAAKPKFQPRDGRRERKDNRGERNKDNKDPRERSAKKVPGKGMNSAFSKSMESGMNLANNFIPVNVSSAVKRSDLLRHATILTFDLRTAHRRVVLSENNTKASVSDEASAYPDIPPRFTVCSQVLCSKGFSQGIHYWEVKMSSSNFCGIGLVYGSIDRKGSSSRLGRNAQSWCIEWFNVKLSAWHNSAESVLVNPNPSRVGVLLNCDAGSATFYNVTDRACPFHTFVFPFSEPVYPAFWIFSSGSSITLCKLSN